jgi:magnesium transporter
MNQVMKTLTIVSTIFIPLTFLAGIYGMNFNNMPELKWQNGYFMVLILCLIIAFLMIVYFKRKKWF